MTLDSISVTNSSLTAVILISWIKGSSFWLNCFAAVLFALGMFLTVRKSAKRTDALDRVIAFGPFFFGWPLAVFGAQHIAFLSDVVKGVPAWMPGHLFWAVFVGIALIAAALSMTTGILAEMAGLGAGVMLLLFVLMIYVPNLIENPRDLAVTQLLRDLSMSGGALALAGALAKNGGWRGFGWIAVIGRYFFAAGILDFGVENFLHPEYAPVVPQPDLMMPAWIPAHMVYAWLTGAILVVCGVAMLLNWRTRLAGVVVGIALFALLIFFYLPMEVVHPSIEISGELDQLAQALGMSGAALLVAGSAKIR
ncbi:MAG: hypothetical protein ABSE46_07565 [Terracidiphilus sp.]|jgi:uncharacterized membrane protein YphA (DoxX/SURF4 family)